MSVARGAAGSSTTSPGPPGCSAAVIPAPGRPLEEVAAEEVVGARALHVRPGVYHDIPAPGAPRELLVEKGPDVGVALAVGDDLVQGELDRAVRLAAAGVDVGHVVGGRRQPADLDLDRGGGGAGKDRDGAGCLHPWLGVAA